jgi:hypothetical protein
VEKNTSENLLWQLCFFKVAFLPDNIAILLLQNFFNWFTATILWFPFLGFYNRLIPIFSQVPISPTSNEQLFHFKVISAAFCTFSTL